MDTSTSTSTSTCHRLKTAVEELKNEIDRFENDSKKIDEKSEVVNFMFSFLLEIIHGYYQGKELQKRAMTIELGGNVERITQKLPYNELYNNALLLWIRTRFLGFIHSRIPFIDEQKTNNSPEPMLLDEFVGMLYNKIIETKDILKGKNDNDGKVMLGNPASFHSVREMGKQLFGIGRQAKYTSLLKDAEVTGAEVTHILYFLMVYTLGIIAIELCKEREEITYIKIKDIVRKKLTPYQLTQLTQLTQENPNPSPPPSSGGATSRRRRRRRSHSSLHSRKSINRNKKSKKIRKIYTSKRRARRRNQNKSKNKSRK
jgi:hypothetical protein